MGRKRPAAAGAPNVLLASIDTLGADHVHCYGSATRLPRRSTRWRVRACASPSRSRRRAGRCLHTWPFSPAWPRRPTARSSSSTGTRPTSTTSITLSSGYCWSCAARDRRLAAPGRWSFAVTCPLAPGGSASYRVPVRRPAPLAPRFLRTPPHESALALRSGRRDLLPPGLAPHRRCPCWALRRQRAGTRPALRFNR